MRTEELAGMRERHDDYIARVKELGKVVVSFKAPCCGKDIETPAAPAGQRWDTLATCQHCGELYMKITDGEHAVGLIPRRDMKTAAIQVVPVYSRPSDTPGCVGQVVDFQLEGPDDHTTGWAVYERKEDGTAEWFADTGTEENAMWIGRQLGILHRVTIEPQPWRTPC